MNMKSLPKTWKSSTLQKLALLIKDGSHGSHADHLGGIPLLSAKDIQNGKVNFTNNPRLVSMKDFKDIHKKYALKDGDILITLVGSIGRIAIVENYANNYTLQRSVGIFRPSSEGISKYFYYAFNETNFQRELSKKENKGAQGGVYLGNLGKIHIALPSIPEQNRIVAVLETWDKAIEKLVEKIECKKKVKKQLMRDLLSGKRRLTGFNDEWVTVELRNISSINMGQSPPSTAYNELGNGLPLIQGNNDIKNRRTIARIWTIEITKVAEVGDIIMTVRAPVGLIGSASQKVCLGRGVCSIRPTKIHADYLMKLLESYENKWKSLEQGSTFFAVNSADIKSLPLLIPTTRDEQIAITNILIGADKELDLLKKKLSLIHDQKKHLLNNLITGTILTPENLLAN